MDTLRGRTLFIIKHQPLYSESLFFTLWSMTSWDSYADCPDDILVLHYPSPAIASATAVDRPGPALGRGWYLIREDVDTRYGVGGDYTDAQLLQFLFRMLDTDHDAVFEREELLAGAGAREVLCVHSRDGVLGEVGAALCCSAPPHHTTPHHTTPHHTTPHHTTPHHTTPHHTTLQHNTGTLTQRRAPHC